MKARRAQVAHGQGRGRGGVGGQGRKSLSPVRVILVVALCVAVTSLLVYYYSQQKEQTVRHESHVVRDEHPFHDYQSLVGESVQLKGIVGSDHDRDQDKKKKQNENIQSTISQQKNIIKFNKSKVLSIILSLKERVRKLRSSKKVKMPVDPEAIELTTLLQNVTRCYLLHTLPEYLSGGELSMSSFPSSSLSFHSSFPPLFLAVELKFPRHMIDSDTWLENSTSGLGIITLYVELAPPMLLPHSIFTIVQIVESFVSGHFHRNAGHVLQCNIKAKYSGGVVFMEYDRTFPHEKFTLGFAGRGGGNAFYISTQNNTLIHGPGTDRGGKDPESDSNFGIIIPGYNGEQVVKSMSKQTGPKSKSGFIESKKHFIDILSLRLLNGKTLLNEMGSPRETKKSKYSIRQKYLKDLRSAITFASADEYCSNFL